MALSGCQGAPVGRRARAASLPARGCGKLAGPGPIRKSPMPTSTALETTVPVHSRAQALLPGASFHDAWRITVADTGRSALDLFLVAARQTPRWVEACMALRNQVGRRVGLKHLGGLSAVVPGQPASAYRPGDRVGIFTLFENHFDEALLGDRDRHLDVTLSVHRRALPGGLGVEVTVSTIVRVKNIWGRLYMLPVQPMHRRITPAVLAGIARP